MKKLKSIVILLSMLVASIGVGTNAIVADEFFDIKENVVYSEDNAEATITLDATSIEEGYTLEEVKDPKGNTMDLSTLMYVVNENGTYAFKVFYSDSEKEILEYTKTIVVDAITEIKEEAPKGGLLTINPLSITNPSGDSLSVIFDRDSGSDIDWTSTDQIDWNYYDTQKMEITAVFSDKGIIKDRYIDVNIPDGYSILGYSAKVGTTSQNGESIIETTDIVQQAMESSILTSQNGGAFGNEIISGYNVTDGYSYNGPFSEAKKSGKIHYEFNEEADTVILTLLIGIDYKLYNYMDTQTDYSDVLGTISAGTNTGTLLDALEVKQTSGSEVLSETLQANVKGIIDAMYLHPEGAQDTTYIDDTNYSPEYTPTGGTLWLYNEPRPFTLLADEIIITYTYPKGAEYTGLIGSLAVDAGNMTVNNDTTKRQVTFTYTAMAFQQRVYLARPVFRLSGAIYGTEDGKEKTATYQTSMAIKPYGSETYFVNSRSWTTKLVEADLPLELTGYSAAVYNYAAHGYTDGYQYFGGFGVVNPGFVDKKDIDLSWTFNETLGTRIIRLAMPGGTTISDLMLYTTKHPEGISIPDMTSTDISYGTGAIIDADTLGLDADEYITKVEGIIDTYVAQAGIGNLAWASEVFGYASYGVLQGSINGSQTLTIDGVSATALTTPTDMRLIDANWVGVTALESEYYPGDAIHVNTSFSSNVTNYNRDTRVTDNFIQDPTMYVRVPEGFTLDETTLSFQFLGVDITDKATLASKYIDADGATIYKYSFNDPYTVMAGPQMKGNTGSYTSLGLLYIDFDLKVASSNQGTAELLLRDVVMLEGKGNFVGYDGNETYIRNDDFDLTDTGNNLLAPDTTKKIVVVKKPELQIDSGIRIKNSENDFKTYDGSDSTIAGLSRSKNAEVEVSYYNNAPNAFDTTNIYFPIPKAGKDYGKYFNNKALSDPLNMVDSSPFTWSTSITGEINVPGFTTYYATDGAVNSTNNDGTLGWEAFVPSSGWKTFSEVTNLEDVVFLKFIANNPIASGATGSFVFDLKVATSTPADVINYWRTYTTSQAEGKTTQSGVVGSVLAATVSIGEIMGQVFYDMNYNGIYDTGDTLYTGNNVTINISEKDGKITTTTLPIQSDGTFSITELKEGNYSISAVNNNTTTYHFTKTTTSTDTIIGSNVSANGTNSEGRLDNLEIISGVSEVYDTLGIGLVESRQTVYQFEDRVQEDTNLNGKAKITLGSTTIEYNGTLTQSAFPKETFGVTPTVTLPLGMVHVGWQVYKNDSGTLTKMGGVITPEDFAETIVPIIDTDETIVVEAIVSYGPTITANNLVKYVGDTVNLLEGVSAVDEDNAPMMLSLLAVKNTEVTHSMPITDGKYTTAGTYEVTIQVTDLSTGSSSIVKRIVKVNEAPTVTATPQKYTVGDSNILTSVANNPTASWKKASDTVGTAPTNEVIVPTTITNSVSGPSNDFSVEGIYEVTYTATNPDGKVGTKTVEVLLVDSTSVSDVSGDITIDANNFIVENIDAKNLTEIVARDASHGNASAYAQEKDSSDIVIGYTDVTTSVTVNEEELEVIQKAGVAGGIFDLTYTVTKDGKSVSKTVKVLVKPLNYEESSDSSLIIDASDFVMRYLDSKVLDSTTANTEGKSVAYKVIKDADGKITGFSEMTAIPKAEDMTTIKNGSNVGGKYDLQFLVNDGIQTAEVTIKVTVLPEEGIAYKVEHYLEQPNGSYALEDTENATGTAGTNVTAEANNYTGYTLDTSVTGTVKSGTVAGDGSLVLKLYYTANTDTEYKVEYYLEQVDGSYTLEETINLVGTTNSTVDAEIKGYKGYAFVEDATGNILTGVVKADGSLRLKVYYNQVKVSSPEQEIDMKENTYPEDKNGAGISTGDYTNSNLFIAMMLGVLGVMVVVLRKKEHN